MSLEATISLSLSLLLGLVGVSLGKESLYLLSLLPYPSDVPSLQPSWDGAPSVIPAAYLAVDQINNSSRVLPNYRLELVNGDGGCDITNKAVVNFVRYAIHGVKPIVGVIGSGCSASTLALAPLLTMDHGTFSLVNIHLGASPLLSEPENRDLYSNSFGIVGSSYGYVKAIAALMRETGWRKVAVLYEEERVFFRSTYTVLKENLTFFIPDAEIAFSTLVSNEFEVPISRIKDELVRVILVLTSSKLARTIMCLASHVNMYYPAYQWVLVNRDLSVFEDVNVTVGISGKKHTCHASRIPSALDRTIFLNYRLSALDEDGTAVSGITHSEFQDMYTASVDQYNNRNTRIYSLPGAERNASLSKFATLIYDATWAFALALDKLERSGVNLSLYTIGQPNTTQLLKEALYSNCFHGVSGLVKFDPTTGFAERTFVVTQVFNEVEQSVGYTNSAMFTEFGKTIISIPDGIEVQTNTIHSAAAAVFATVTLTLMALIITTHVITILNQKYHSIKAKSRRLNQVIYLGAYISGVGSLLYIVFEAIPMSDWVYGIFCQAVWAWLLPISYTLMMSAICARTWRLYRIFTHYLDPGPFISDPVLLTAAAVLVAIDIVIAVVWTMVDPLTSRITTMKISEGETQILETERICDCKFFVYWILTSHGYHILLLLLAVVLSLLTKSIKKRSFNTKSLRILVYLLAFLRLGGYTIYFVLILPRDTNIYVDYILLCFMLNILLFLVLSLVFFPPILPLLQEWIAGARLPRKVKFQRHEQTQDKNIA